MSEGEVGDINVDVNGDENMIEGEVGDNNVDVNGAEDMGEGEVEDNNVNVNEAEDMSDSDDVSFQYDSVLDVAFQDSDEDNDDLVEEGITHLLAMTRRKKVKTKNIVRNVKVLVRNMKALLMNWRMGVKLIMKVTVIETLKDQNEPNVKHLR